MVYSLDLQHLNQVLISARGDSHCGCVSCTSSASSSSLHYLHEAHRKALTGWCRTFVQWWVRMPRSDNTTFKVIRSLCSSHRRTSWFVIESLGVVLNKNDWIDPGWLNWNIWTAVRFPVIQICPVWVSVSSHVLLSNWLELSSVHF